MVDEPTEDAFIVDLDGFEGPLDLLLDLARAQRSTSPGSRSWTWPSSSWPTCAGVQARQLQIAAEYLVMAAWLAYLKSQLLLPPAERELADAEALAEDLGDRLRRLEALRQAAASSRSGRGSGPSGFARGLAGGRPGHRDPGLAGGLGELFAAYGAVMRGAARSCG